MVKNGSPVRRHAHLREHIDLIARHEEEFLAQRTTSERLGDRMASLIGSLAYIAGHLIVVGVWVLWNTVRIGSLPHFDPVPFPLMDVILSLEAILVASFILMRQSRMSRRSEERDQLMLQMLLLAERESTASLSMQQQMAERMGLQGIADDEEITQLSQQTSVDEIASIIKESLPNE
jgi:uncharacterized membrane protein